MSENRKTELRSLIKAAGLTQTQAAETLHVSPHTIKSWLKPDTSRSASPVPAWALELLALKTGQAVPDLAAM